MSPSTALSPSLALAPAAVLILALAVYGITSLASRRRGSPDPDAVRKGGRRLLGLFLRDYWYWLHGPAERLVLRRGLTPNQLTLIGTAVTLAAGLAFALGWFALGGWLILAGGSFDLLDGRVARRTGQETAAGAFLDSTLDRYGDWGLLAGLAWFFSPGPGLALALAALAGTYNVSYARARAESLGIECRDGLLQRAERMVILASAGILAPIWAWLSGVDAAWLPFFALGILAVFGNWTAVQRIRAVLRALEARHRLPGPLHGEPAQRAAD